MSPEGQASTLDVHEQAMQEVFELKNERRGRLSELADDKRFDYLEGRRPWHIPADIALPCATQNELDEKNAKDLVKKGVKYVAEGANMPTTPEGITALQAAAAIPNVQPLVIDGSATGGAPIVLGEEQFITAPVNRESGLPTPVIVGGVIVGALAGVWVFKKWTRRRR